MPVIEPVGFSVSTKSCVVVASDITATPVAVESAYTGALLAVTSYVPATTLSEYVPSAAVVVLAPVVEITTPAIGDPPEVTVPLM